MKLNFTTSPLIVALAALVGAVGLHDAAQAQEEQDNGSSSGRARVLVAVFQTQPGIDDGFGEEIAEKLRERVRDFDLLTTVSEDEVDNALDRFDLEATQLDLISWRQLASRLNAQLIVYGEVSRAGGSSGNRVQALFVESSRSDSTEVPPFTVSGDGGDEAEEAAERISRTLEEHVEFLRARLNCQDYLSSDQLDDATRNCDRALSLRPDNGQALYLRGQIAAEAENWEEAVQYLERALEQAPSNDGVLQTLAYAHAQAGNTERSVELYRDYLEFNPDDVDVRLSVAYNLATAEAFSQAMQILQDGLERDSTQAGLWKYLGDVAVRKGMAGGQRPGGGSSSIADSSAIRTAVRAYDRYTSLEPDSADVSLYRNMIAAHRQLGEVEEAAQLTSRALLELPDAPELWSIRADVLAQRKDLAGAIAAMDSVLALDDEYRNAHFKRGVFKLRNGQVNSAMTDFRAAVQQGTDRNTVAQQLYATGHGDYFQNGRYQQAVRMFETSLEFAQDQRIRNQLHFWIGWSYYRLGQNIDDQNPDENCQPARRALGYFQNVLPHLDQAGDYQAQNQAKIRQAADTFAYRQEQIVKKACR